MGRRLPPRLRTRVPGGFVAPPPRVHCLPRDVPRTRSVPRSPERSPRLLPAGQVQSGRVPLDDASAVLPFDQVADAAEEALPGGRVQGHVAGVGAQNAQVALRVVGLVPPVVAPDDHVEQAGGLDLGGPVRQLVGLGPPLVVVGLDDLRRLALIDLLGGLEEALARVSSDVLVPEEGQRPPGRSARTTFG